MSIAQDRPAYRILSPNGFYADDHLYSEGEKIYFDGIPNEEMEPLNTIALDRLTAYVERLDSLAKDAAEKFGRPYSGRPRTLDGQLALASEFERNSMQIMGNKEAVRTVDRIETEDTPEMGDLKRGRGRPRKAPLSVAA